MEILKLREICQKSREQNYGKEPFADQILRFFSIYITAILIKIKWMTPNLVTVISAFIGAIGCNFIIKDYVIFGTFLVYIFLILDACDGEVARYKKLSSPQGLYLDYMAHIMVFTVFLLGLGLSTGRVGAACIAIIGFLWFEIPINYNNKIYNEYKKSGRKIDLKPLPKSKGQPTLLSKIKAFALQATGYVEMVTLTLILSFFGLELYALIYYAIAKTGLAVVNFYYEYKIGLRRLL